MEINFYCDDGSKEDVRVAELLEKYGFRGIFYIAPFNTKLSSAEIKRISEKHEIGGHTLNHTRLTYLPISEQFDEIFKGKIELVEQENRLKYQAIQEQTQLEIKMLAKNVSDLSVAVKELMIKIN